MKTILVLLDGIGDRSYKILNHRTPLQTSVTPNLDRLALLGSNGLFHPAMSGQCLPSETAHYLLFGYNLEKFPGRGLLEAVGDGVDFQDRDVLCLAHLAGVTWEDSVPILTQGRKDIEGNAKALEEFFKVVTPYEAHGITFRLQQTGGNDGILILSGQASPFISDCDPMVSGRPMARILPLSNNPEPEEAARTAKALNQYLTSCHQVLTNHDVNRVRRAKGLHPVNFLATQRCGRRIPQEPFDQRWGLKGMVIASGSIYGGLAHELGLTFRRVRDTQEPGEDLKERIRLALAEHSHDFIHVHTKVPDEAAHKGDPRHKEAVIAALDRGFDELVKAVESRDDLLVVVTSDHSTPSISPLIHSGEPLPLTLAGQNIRRDEVKAFDEVSAATGSLGLLRGRELMLMILNCADRSSLLGHHLGATKGPYVPDTYEPFKLTSKF